MTMKHNIQYYIVTILSSMLMCACDEGYDDFSFTPPSWNVIMSGDADVRTITIYASKADINYSWQNATSSAEWLTCTKSGNNLTLTVKANTTSAERTATVSIEAYAGHEIATINVTQPGLKKKNGHGYVDLGLPSGLLWATCNVGASSPFGAGNYYAWGETSTKSDYSSSTSLTYGKTIEKLKTLGIIGSDGNLTPAHDAARVAWGGTWRMPTREEIQELKDNTTTTRTELNSIEGYNSVEGYCVISKNNGNSIFLPCAGRLSGDRDIDEGVYYLSSSLGLHTTDCYSSYGLGCSYSYSNSHLSEEFSLSCYYGCSIRPVTEP